MCICHIHWQSSFISQPHCESPSVHVPHGHRSCSRVCHARIFPLIKFTLPVSCTPSCDGWLIWLFLLDLPVCVYVLRLVWALAGLFELWPCVSAGGKTIEPYFVFCSKGYICFMCCSRWSSSGPKKVSESAETRGKQSRAALVFHRGPLSELGLSYNWIHWGHVSLFCVHSLCTLKGMVILCTCILTRSKNV